MPVSRSARGSRCARDRSAPSRRAPTAPREEWLIIEWPEGKTEPTDYWLANLAADSATERLARLARLRWMTELDYRQLKGELGLDHYEGRSYLGFHHHCAIVIAANGFLNAGAAEPKSPAAGLTLPQAVLLFQPLFKCWTGRCSTCQQTIDLADLPIHSPPQQE